MNLHVFKDWNPLTWISFIVYQTHPGRRWRNSASIRILSTLWLHTRRIRARRACAVHGDVCAARMLSDWKYTLVCRLGLKDDSASERELARSLLDFLPRGLFPGEVDRCRFPNANCFLPALGRVEIGSVRKVSPLTHPSLSRAFSLMYRACWCPVYMMLQRAICEAYLLCFAFSSLEVFALVYSCVFSNLP